MIKKISSLPLKGGAITVATFLCFFLVGCEKDDSLLEVQQNEQLQKPLFHIHEKSFAELEKDPLFLSSMRTALPVKGSTAHGKTVMEEQYGFTIDSSIVKEYSVHNPFITIHPTHF